MAPQSFVAALACLALLYTLMPRLRRGLPRLLLLLPCLPIFAWVPFSTHSYFLRGNFSFFFLWICPSKLLLLSWDLSPESSLSHGFLYFVITTVFPVRVKGKASTASAITKPGAHLNFPNVINFVLFLVALNGCLYGESLPLWQIHALYCLMLFLSLELNLALLAKLATVLLGVETYPPSDNPFVASSLSEFWGKRWNLVATNMLRLTVYAPVLHFLSGGQEQDALKKHATQSRKARKDAGTHEVETKTSSSRIKSRQTRGLKKNSISKHHNVQPELSPGVGYDDSKNMARNPYSARAIAVLASFLVSGLIHELIFASINQAQPTWEVTMFFILHGFATALEAFLCRQLPSGWKLPQPVAIFCTLGFIFCTATWLFMPPLTRAGTDKHIIAELNHIQSVTIDLFRRQ